MAGPVCTSLLRDMGAEVIKVEPLNGEAGRYGGAYPTPYGESLTFQVHNRGKMSMTVNLKTEEGKALFRDLIRVSDACVENFRPGVMDRLGIGYEDLRKLNPTIVLASISGFGQVGPYSQLPCVDFIAQGDERADEPQRPARRPAHEIRRRNGRLLRGHVRGR